MAGAVKRYVNPAQRLSRAAARARVGPMGLQSDGVSAPVVAPAYYAPAPLGYNVLPYNTSSVETDTSGWTVVSGCTLAQQSSPAYAGTHSLAVTCTATTSVLSCSWARVWGGITYYPIVWAQAAAAGCTLALRVDWVDPTGAVTSATSPAAPIRSDGTWGEICGQGAVAPATAVAARLTITITSPGGGTVVSLDAAYLGAHQDPPPFTSNTYLAWDPATASYPQWIDATPYVENDSASITIQHGRQDGLSDVNSGSLAATVDNSDGRWFVSNPNGAWYGGLRKGAWIKQTVSVYGQEWTRFVGFITALPKQGLGAYQSVQLGATDWLGHLGQHNPLNTSLWHESQTDPAGLPAPWAYYALNEQAAATAGTGQAGNITTANDTSGYASQLGRAFPLVPRPTNVGGGAINWANANGPGFDGDQAISFAPASTTSGYTLFGQLARTLGSSWMVRFWVRTTQSSPSFVTLSDYSSSSQSEITFALAGGSIAVIMQGTAATSTVIPGLVTWNNANSILVTDGNWHLLSFYGRPDPANPGQTLISANVDGVDQGGYDFQGVSTSLQWCTVGGYDDSKYLTSQVNLMTGAVYGLTVVDMTGVSSYATFTASCANAFKAGATGDAYETTGARLARIARYAGVPAAWTNFDTGVSQVGPQSYNGRYPLDVMRECARTEGMPLYCGTDGRITFRARTARYNPSPAWTHAAADLDPSSAFADDFSYVINQAQMSRVGGGTIIVNGARGLASQGKYGLYYTSQQTAAIDDTNLTNLGLWLLLGTADPSDRFLPVAEYASLAFTPSPLAVAAGWGQALYQAVLSADLSTHQQITGMPSNTPSPTLTLVIEGWTENITAATHSIAWSTTNPIATGVWQLDVSPYNQLDAGYILAY